MKLRAHWLVLLLALMPWAAGAESADYAEGINFERIAPPLPTSGGDKVQVTEFFWYGCPHCYQFEPYLKAWLAQKPDYVEFEQVPAIFDSPRWELHARAFYTAEVLGVLDRLHPALFEAIHEHKRRLLNRDALKAFFAEHGVEAEAFDSTFNSFAVENKVRRAKDLTQRSGIGGVPATAVDGRFRIEAGMATTYKILIDTTRYLARQVHEGELQ